MRSTQQRAHNEIGAGLFCNNVALTPRSNTCPKVSDLNPRDSIHTNFAVSRQS
jgi:hypothetical protein